MTAGLTEFVSNVGFPIVAFVLMYRMSRQTIKENTEAIQKMNNEIGKLAAQVNRNE